MGTVDLQSPVAHIARPTPSKPDIAHRATCAEIVSGRDLDQLTGPGGGAHVSLFAPVISWGPQAALDRIRWKTLLARTEAALRDVTEPAQAEAAFAAVRDIAPEARGTGQETRGVAIFARPGWARCFRLPVELPELAAVGERFLIAPLLDIVSPGQRFLLLVLNRARVRLYRGTRFGIEEVPADELPAGPADPSTDRRGDVLDRPEAFVTGRGGSRSGAVFYGRGSVDQQRREQILQYFRTVEATLRDFSDGDQAPLLLAGAADLIPLFRQVCRYPRLVDDALTIDPTRLSLDTLHELAWTRVEPQFGHAQAAAARRYRDRAGTGWTVSEPAEVLAAAETGRIDALFLAAPTFARRTANHPPVLRLTDETSSAADQLDRAAAHCLAYGGNVYLVPAERMPDPSRAGGSPAAALLRF